jgi:hypothetical protein
LSVLVWVACSVSERAARPRRCGSASGGHSARGAFGFEALPLSSTGSRPRSLKKGHI